MEFRKNYNYYTNAPTPSGEKEIPVYEMQIKKGVKVLVKTEKTKNIYDRTQAPLEETKIENLLKRVAAGETELLNKRNGSYLDLTQLPRTVAEWENLRIKGENLFAQEPLEVRKALDYSVQNYVESIVNGTYAAVYEKATGKKLKEETKETVTTTTTQTTNSGGTTTNEHQRN